MIDFLINRCWSSSLLQYFQMPPRPPQNTGFSRTPSLKTSCSRKDLNCADGEGRRPAEGGNAQPRLLAAVGLLLPTSTADCERGFSTLKRVKTAQRNCLQNEALNAVLRVSIEGPSVADFSKREAEKMVCEWAREKRRLLV